MLKSRKWELVGRDRSMDREGTAGQSKEARPEGSAGKGLGFGLLIRGDISVCLSLPRSQC